MPNKKYNFPKFEKSLGIFFLLFYCFFVLQIFLFSYQLFSNSYESFTYQLLEKYQYLNKLEKFRTKIFTPLLFKVLRVSSVSLSIFLIFISLFLKKIIKNILKSDFLQKLIFYLHKTSFFLEDFTKTQKTTFWILFVLTFFIKVYFIFNFPLHIDEVFSYIYFINKGFLVSAAYYPGPNNHIFYNLLTSFLENDFLPKKFNIRVLSLIISQSLLILFILFFKKMFQQWTTIFVSFGIAFSAPFFLYSIYGRGYILQFFWIIISLFALQKIIIQVDKIFFRKIFIITSILGFYSIPTFIYPFLSSIFLYLIFFQKVNYRHFITDLFLIFIGIFALYLPVFALNGLGTVFNSVWVKRLSLEVWIRDFPVFIENLSHFFFDIEGIEIIYFLFLGFIFFRFLFKSKKSFYDYTAFYYVFIPIVLIFIQRVLPPPRVFMYQFFFLILGSFYFSFLPKNQISKKITLSLSILLFFIFSFKNYQEYYFLTKELPSYEKVSLEISKKDYQKIYCNEDVYFNFLKYYHRTCLKISFCFCKKRPKY